MLVWNVELADDDLDIDARRVDGTQHFDDAAGGTARGGGPARDLDHHHQSGFCRSRFTARHLDVGHHTAVERHDVAETRGVDVEAADNGLLAALEDADDAPLESLFRLALHAHHHAIAVHRLGEIGSGDVDVLPFAGLRLLGYHETEPSGVGREPADDEVHLVGKTETVAANLQQCSVGDELLELAGERLAFFARHLEQL